MACDAAVAQRRGAATLDAMSTADTPDDELPDADAELHGGGADDDELPGTDPDADDPDPDTDASPLRASPAPNRSRTRGSLVAAAMLGLGQVIEPEKTKVVIEQTDDDPFGGDTDLELTFDRLPPVDDS